MSGVSHHRPFLALWVLAVAASVAAFVLHLAMRSRSMHLGYELGRARAEQARLREVKRVLELEVASYHTPQRVEVVARTLLGMAPPAPDRIIAMASPKEAAQPSGAGSGAVAVERPAKGGKGALPAGSTPAAPGAAGAPAAAPTATELLAPRITPPKTAQVPEAAQEGQAP